MSMRMRHYPKSHRSNWSKMPWSFSTIPAIAASTHLDFSSVTEGTKYGSLGREFYDIVLEDGPIKVGGKSERSDDVTYYDPARYIRIEASYFASYQIFVPSLLDGTFNTTRPQRRVIANAWVPMITLKAEGSATTVAGNPNETFATFDIRRYLTISGAGFPVAATIDADSNFGTVLPTMWGPGVTGEATYSVAAGDLTQYSDIDTFDTYTAGAEATELEGIYDDITAVFDAFAGSATFKLAAHPYNPNAPSGLNTVDTESY